MVNSLWGQADALLLLSRIVFRWFSNEAREMCPKWPKSGKTGGGLRWKPDGRWCSRREKLAVGALPREAPLEEEDLEVGNGSANGPPPPSSSVGPATSRGGEVQSERASDVNSQKGDWSVHAYWQCSVARCKEKCDSKIWPPALVFFL